MAAHLQVISPVCVLARHGSIACVVKIIGVDRKERSRCRLHCSFDILRILDFEMSSLCNLLTMTILSTDQPRGQRELEIRSAWSDLLRNSSSPEAVAAQQQASSSSSSGPYPRLRSVRYAESLDGYPPSSSPSEWISSAQASRADYARRRASYLRAPDGTLPQGIPPNEVNEVEDAPIHDLSINNPLSLDDANPWSTYSVHMATLQEILTDVVRLQPEETPSEGGAVQGEPAKALLLQDHVQRSLSHLLFVWARRNEDVGYRQGMHELAATLYLVRSNDALPCRKPANEDRLDADVAGTLLDRFYIEHDTYILFDKLMIHARAFYEWKGRPPILDRCEQVAAQLRLCDPTLYQHLQALQIQPQLYLLRWLRLLFLREFPLQASLEFWDHLLARDPTLALLDWICVALLIRRRNKLLRDSQTDVLAALLHGQDDAAVKFPPAASPSGRSDPPVAPGIAPHHTPLLVLQAVQLQSNPTPSTGMQCVMQNTELLGLALSPPTPTVSSDSSSSQRSGGRIPGAFNRRVPNDLPPAAAALSDLAKSLYSRSDVLVSTAQRAGAIAYAAAYGPDPRNGERRDGFPDRDRLEEIERARRLKQQPQTVQQGGSTVQSQPRLSIKERLQAVTDVRPFGQELDRMRDQSEKMGHALDQVVDVFEQGSTLR